MFCVVYENMIEGEGCGKAYTKEQCVRIVKIKKHGATKESEEEERIKCPNGDIQRGLVDLIDDHLEVSEIKRIMNEEVINRQLKVKDGIYGEQGDENGGHYGIEGSGYFVENWIKCD